MSYHTFEAIEEVADAIIIAKTKQDFSKREHSIQLTNEGTIQDFHTLTVVEVLDIVKQPLTSPLTKNTTLKIVEPIAYDRKLQEMYTMNNYRAIGKNKTYVLFLAHNGQDNYGIINMNNGKFLLKDSANENNSSIFMGLKQNHTEIIKKYQ